MSIAQAQRVILERLGAGATVIVAVLLSARLAWADGVDPEGRAVARWIWQAAALPGWGKA